MTAVVGRGEDRDARWIVTLSRPHVQLVPTVFLLMSSNQTLDVGFIKELSENRVPKFD